MPGCVPTSASAAGGVVEGDPPGDQPARIEPAGGDEAEQLAGSACAAMPWLPSSCSSSAITRSIGTSGRPARAAAGRPARAGRGGAGSATEFDAVAGAPSASRDTWAPPPVSSATAAATSSAPSTACSAPSSPGQRQRAGRRRRRRSPARPAAAAIMHRGQPDPAAAVHGQPLAGAHPAHVRRRPGRRSRSGSPSAAAVGQVELVRERRPG